MTDSELDGLLLLAYFPNNKEKLNLSRQDLFVNTILSKVAEYNLEDELGENMINFFPQKVRDSKEPGKHILQGFLSDIRIVKMAALKTYDDFREMLP
jgi:hypothetical protein